MRARRRAADPVTRARPARPGLTLLGDPVAALALTRLPLAGLGARADRPAQSRVPARGLRQPIVVPSPPAPQYRLDHRANLPRQLIDSAEVWLQFGPHNRADHRTRASRRRAVRHPCCVQHNQVQVAGIGTPADASAPDPPQARTARRLPGPDSIWWLVAVAAAFTGVQLIFVRLHGLSWDEVVYVSQVSRHAPAAPFDPARSRGIPLLVAPIALITSSVTVLRIYLAAASGAALLGALLAWRRLRPASLLALAGVAFGSLWVAQYYGPQAMPDEWLAFAALAATGLFLRTVTVDETEEPRARLIRLAGLAALIAAAALIRPGDALFLVIVLLAAALAVRPWRQWPVIAAIVIGMAA